ncbi:SUMO-activating enzyme subunit 1-like [Ptychodera flava]|uniref:SUMO-activating enzyme subunit 1-like n=1 Tax=Ptychodera flava TaxID=63121 RepID=UPI00396A2B27
MVDHHNDTITEDEAALYDRQIRLWGLDAQKRLRSSSMLLVGLKGVGAEVCKNVVLSGVKSVTLLDHTSVTEEDAFSQFLVGRDSVGKNRAEASLERTKELNPNVEVLVDTANVSDKPKEFFQKFNIVCATCCDCETLLKINEICHESNVKFFACDVFGYYGYMFSDLVEHNYVEEKQKITKPDEPQDGSKVKKSKVAVVETETVMVKKSMKFCRLHDALSVDWTEGKLLKSLKRLSNVYFLMQILLKFRAVQGRDPSSRHMEEDTSRLLKIRDEVMEEKKVPQDKVKNDFTRFCIGELSPACAVVGGIVGQEVVKAVSGKDTPHNNFFFFDGTEGSGIVDQIGAS